MTRSKFILFVLFLLHAGALLSHPGIGIVEDSKGNIFYTDLTQVWKIAPDGRRTLAVSSVHTHELYLDGDDNLFGEHLWYNGESKNTWGYYVWRLSADGKLDKVIPPTEGFRESYSFVRDHQGNMFMPDRTGACQKLLRKRGNTAVHEFGHHCYQNIRWMNTTRKNEVLVVDFQDIKKVDPEGNLVTIASQISDKKVTRSNTDNQNAVMGVWDDANGNIYAAVVSLRLVKKFGGDGKESPPIKISWPWFPTGGVVDHAGRLWILESNPENQVRVERIEKDGNRLSF